MKQDTPNAGWLESHDNPVTNVVRRVRDTIKEAIQGDAGKEDKPAAKRKRAARKRARPAAKKAGAGSKTARPAAKKTRSRKSSRTSARPAKKSRKRAARK
jgi:hypothetical protein